jgi:hypothetical protein
LLPPVTSAIAGDFVDSLAAFAALEHIGPRSNMRLSTALLKIVNDYVIRRLNALPAGS